MKTSPHLKIVFITLILLINSVFTVHCQELSDTIFKYFEGKTAPDSDWNSHSFNDDSWKTGIRSVGYGDNDDETLIDTVSSVFVRMHFNVEDKSVLNDLALKLDFDDGFCAYINGVEFARVNLGKHYSSIDYNQLADRSHEAELYRPLRSRVLGYYINDTIVEKYMVTGDNVLAIEVHNDSVKGSDLTLKPRLYNLKGYYNLYESKCRYKQSVELDSTHLPIFLIETDEYSIQVKRMEVKAHLQVINNGAGKFNKPSDSSTDYDGRISIEVRGESSADFPKRSYDFETQDIDGNDTSIALLGLPKENDWVLQGPFADKSQIRNALIYDLGRETGSWHPRVRFCEVVLNGEFIGLYCLIERIKRDSSRVNIAKLKTDEIVGDDLTGGYILKYDKGSKNIQIVYPKSKNLQPEQNGYIKNYLSEYNKVLKSNNGLDSELGYQKYIDIQSLIDYVILAEFGKNCDSYLYSSYIYKDKDSKGGKLHFGPLWDYDLCFGNASWQNGDKINQWQFEYPANNKFNLKRLLQDPEFANKLNDRWFELRNAYLHTDSLFARIDSLVSYLSEPIKRNYMVWPIISKDLFTQVYRVSNYSGEIDHIKNWITNRALWMDENIGSIYYPVTQYSSIAEESFADVGISQVYPNPFTSEFTLKIATASAADISVRLIGMDGKIYNIIDNIAIQSGEYYLHWQSGNDLNNGMYILEILQNNIPLEQIRMVKLGE